MNHLYFWFLFLFVAVVSFICGQNHERSKVFGKRIDQNTQVIIENGLWPAGEPTPEPIRFFMGENESEENDNERN